jgi:hypothetical protein
MTFNKYLPTLVIKLGAGTEAEAASYYGSGSTEMMQLRLSNAGTSTPEELFCFSQYL